MEFFSHLACLLLGVVIGIWIASPYRSGYQPLDDGPRGNPPSGGSSGVRRP